MNEFISICAFLLLAWQIFFVINFFTSWFAGRRVGRNPWRATSLEWETASPPGYGNFDRRLWVEHGPYEYADPRAAHDFVPQARPLEPVAEPPRAP